jgi:hypothetical protein
MQREEQKNQTDHLEKALEIIVLSVMAIIIYIGGILFLGKPISRYMPVWFLSPLCFLFILALVVAWIIGMKFWRPKNLTVKIVKKILCISVIALFVSVLTHWFILNAFDKMMH